MSGSKSSQGLPASTGEGFFREALLVGGIAWLVLLLPTPFL